jgi:hypothetical protein
MGTWGPGIGSSGPFFPTLALGRRCIIFFHARILLCPDCRGLPSYRWPGNESAGRTSAYFPRLLVGCPGGGVARRVVRASSDIVPILSHTPDHAHTRSEGPLSVARSNNVNTS